MHRAEQFILNGCKSHSSPVSSSVPQGFVLGPFLYTIFINDIPSIMSSPGSCLQVIYEGFLCGNIYVTIQNDFTDSTILARN